MSEERDLKLACLHQAGGNLDHAKSLFDWVSGSVRATPQSEAPAVSAPNQDKPEQPFNYQHPSKYGTDVPRRCYLEELTPEERAIRDLVGAIEHLGAHPLLTTTVIQLMKAGESLADWVDIGLRDKAIAALTSEPETHTGNGEGGLLDPQSPSVDDEVRNQAEEASPEVASEGEATGKVTMRVELPEGFVAWNGASADLPNPDIAPTTLVVTMRRNADFELTIAGDCDWEWAEALERIVPEFEELHDPAEDIIAYKIAVAGVDYETSGYAHVGESSASESDDDRTPAVDGPFASTADLSRSFGHSDVEAESIERGVNAILNRGRFASIETPAEAERTEDVLLESQPGDADESSSQASSTDAATLGPRDLFLESIMARGGTWHDGGDNPARDWFVDIYVPKASTSLGDQRLHLQGQPANAYVWRGWEVAYVKTQPMFAEVAVDTKASETPSELETQGSADGDRVEQTNSPDSSDAQVFAHGVLKDAERKASEPKHSVIGRLFGGTKSFAKPEGAL